MPDGLFQGLSLKEFSDLIAYLASLRSAGQGTPGSGVVGPVALPKGFTRAQVASGITGATAMEIAPDGRVLVCEQTGALRVVKDGAMLPRPLVRVAVDSEWERGLIGVALDPNFTHNGFVYLCYVAASPYIHHRVSRFQARGDVAEPASERVLWEGDDQAKLGGHTPAGHQGGAIHFGADGKLYIAIGDQTAGAPSQRLDTFQGKLLRLNPDGSIPADNPFVPAAKGKYRAIWALGLRNPFTFAVQPVSGRIFINDVGETRWEEIDEGFAGAELWLANGRGPVDQSPLPRTDPLVSGRLDLRRCLLPCREGGQLPLGIPGPLFLRRLRQRVGQAARSRPSRARRDVCNRLLPARQPQVWHRRQPLRLATRCMGQGPELPPWNRVASEDRAQVTIQSAMA